MKKLLILILSSMAFHVVVSAQYMEQIEHAAEYVNSAFGDAPTNNGLIFVRQCDNCTRIGVKFNAKTRYFNGRTPISAKQAVALDGRGATLFFDPHLRNVTRVIFRASKSGARD